MAQSAQTAFRDVFIHVFVLCVLNWASLSWMNFKCERFKTAKHQKLCCSLPSITLTPKTRAGLFQKMHIDCLCVHEWLTPLTDTLNTLDFIVCWQPLGTKLNLAAPNYTTCQDRSGQIHSEQGYVLLSWPVNEMRGEVRVKGRDY